MAAIRVITIKNIINLGVYDENEQIVILSGDDEDCAIRKNVQHSRRFHGEISTSNIRYGRIAQREIQAQQIRLDGNMVRLR